MKEPIEAGLIEGFTGGKNGQDNSTPLLEMENLPVNVKQAVAIIRSYALDENQEGEGPTENKALLAIDQLPATVAQALVEEIGAASVTQGAIDEFEGNESKTNPVIAKLKLKAAEGTVEEVDKIIVNTDNLPEPTTSENDTNKQTVDLSANANVNVDNITGVTMDEATKSAVEADLDTLTATAVAEIEAKIQPIDTSTLDSAISAIQTAIATAVTTLGDLTTAINSLPNKSSDVTLTATAMSLLPDKSKEVGQTAVAMALLPDKSANVNNTANAMNRLHDKSFAVTVNMYTNGSWNTSWSFAKGNTQLNGMALASGTGKKTLMGELGPELVVSGGRYYIVGQNGAEMVNLPSDAIVFNHLQTKKLLENGYSGRGKPVTNEKKAVSYATGNVSGNALAAAISNDSLSQTIKQLKAMRDLFKSIANASFKDLGGFASSSKSKDKSSKSTPVTTKDENGNETTTIIKIARVTDEINRWYNLMRQIDKLDKDIAYSEKLINKYQADRVANGDKIYQNYKTQLKMLDSEINKNKQLVEIQRKWYDDKREELANSSYGLIFQYDENGLQQFVEGENRGLDILEKLNEETVYGRGIHYSSNVERQLDYLRSLGFDINSLFNDDNYTNRNLSIYSYNSIYDNETGEKLEGQDLADIQEQAMQNFYDILNSKRDELDSLFDSMHETELKILDEQIKQNEILQEITDNQLEVEDTVLNAITDAREAEIDELQKERDAYQKSTDKMISGLNKALANEQKMYKNDKDYSELTKLQRQLAILQRSGGSSSQIRDLQSQIDSRQQDLYFNERQKEIDAIQDASDKQIERMDAQIDLMTETLEYQKEHGLLWSEVYNVMSKEESEILNFITQNGADWEAKSSLQKQEDIREILEKIQIWTQSRDDKELQELGIKIDNQDNASISYNDNSSNNNISAASSSTTSSKKSSNTNSSSSSSNSSKSTSNSKSTSSKYTSSNANNSAYKKATSSYNSAHLNEGSTMTYTQKSNGKFKEAEKRIGHSGDSIEVISSNVGYYGSKPVSLIEYNGKRYYIRSERIAYKQGGLIDFTGPAWVDGSKSKPESILSAEQTKTLQDFAHKLTSNTSGINAFNSINFEELYKMRDAIDEMRIAVDKLYDNPNSSDTNNMGITIENVVLNMNVSKIANDYDAARAGQKVLDEFVRVARKNGVNSLSRR